MNTYLKWLGLEEASVRGDDTGIRSVALKQVRDAIETDRACYQAIVGVTRKIEGGWSKVRASSDSLEVRFYTYPGVTNPDVTNPGVRYSGVKYSGVTIYETMGINGALTEDAYHKYYSANTLPGARIYGKMSDQLGQNLCWTIEQGKWQDDRSAAEKFFS